MRRPLPNPLPAFDPIPQVVIEAAKRLFLVFSAGVIRSRMPTSIGPGATAIAPGRVGVMTALSTNLIAPDNPWRHDP
jgi:hypothetical protein